GVIWGCHSELGLTPPPAPSPKRRGGWGEGSGNSFSENHCIACRRKGKQEVPNRTIGTPVAATLSEDRTARLGRPAFRREYHGLADGVRFRETRRCDRLCTPLRLTLPIRRRCVSTVLSTKRHICFGPGPSQGVPCPGPGLSGRSIER